jgi:putative nucleotidyltransferase with HDIG domain
VKIIIDKERVAELKSWFTGYVRSFKSSDKELQQNINLKVSHTKRVCTQIKNISRKLGLSEDESALAEIIALLHDIGRFEQITRYKTYNDSISEDHAELGIKILQEHALLNRFENSTQDVIRCSIKNHNKKSLPVYENEKCLFFTKLLRDADKLDILKVVTSYYLGKNRKENGMVILNLADTPGISTEVYEALINKKTVDIKLVRNLNDFKLLQAGWIYDINFQPSLDIIRESQFIEMIREVLPESKEINEIFDVINSIS